LPKNRDEANPSKPNNSMNELAISAKDLLQKVDALQGSARQKIQEIKDQCEKLSDAGIKVSESWSGSYAGYHAELYYADFDRPPLQHQFDPEWGGINGIPDGWRTRTPDEVKERIEYLAGVKVEQVEKKTGELLESAKTLQRDLVIELSGLGDAKDFEREKELFKQLERLQWTSTKGKFINANTPKTFMSRDSRAMSQGIRVPAHMYYEAVAYDLTSQVGDIEKLLSESEQLLKLLDRKLTATVTAVGKTPSKTELVRTICSKFHSVARQLKHRHGGRPTIQINDEYDVQDLLHSLLRLHFDDVRPEEWTPSYAGGSSRMDFLLKNEQIVVETKMTRSGLGDKQVGEQLITDVARYKEHPDCKILFCFVYDPGAYVRNPRGLEADLNKLSTTGLQVITIITS